MKDVQALTTEEEGKGWNGSKERVQVQNTRGGAGGQAEGSLALVQEQLSEGGWENVTVVEKGLQCAVSVHIYSSLCSG